MNALLLAYLASILSAHAGYQPELDEGIRNWFEDLMHEDSSVRDMARDYLVKLGSPAVPCLVELLQDADSNLRTWVGTTLIAMGDSSVAALERAAHDPALANQARALLRRMGRAG